MRLLPVPSVGLTLFLLVPVALMGLSLFLPAAGAAAFLADAFILVAAASDMGRGFANRRVTLSIIKERDFFMNCPGELRILAEAGPIPGFAGEFRFDLPRFWKPVAGDVVFSIGGGRTETIPYPLEASRRGRYNFSRLHFRFDSPLGLFRFYGKQEFDLELTVYPDYRRLREYLHLAKNNRLFEMGIHRNRYPGRGAELESLREYTRDDDSRHIDWKATARLNKPVTKEFQTESVNDVVLALDCGRLMTSEEGRMSALDLAVEALLLLSHVAQSVGDRIRVITFSDRITGDFTPRRRGNPMRSLMEFIAPVQAEFVESNYPLVFSHLQSTVKKRALVIFVTDLIDDINYSLFRTHLKRLGRRHAVLFLLLRDWLLQEEADKTGDTLSEAYRVGAARSMYVRRHRTVEKLRQSGVNVLDVLPQEVTAGLVDRYLRLKGENRI